MSGRAKAPGDAEGRSPQAARLAKLGLRRDWDFVLHLPLRYEDESRIVPVAALLPGQEVQVEGEIVDARVVPRGRPQLTAALRDDAGDLLQLRWLNFYPSQREQTTVGRRVRAYGVVRGGFGLQGLEMIHPRLRRADASAPPLPPGLTPVYSTTEGLPQRWLRKRIERALRDVDLAAADRADPWVADAGTCGADPMTPRTPVCASGPSAGLVPMLAQWPLSRALPFLHQPPVDVDAQALTQRTHPAWLRVKFEELLAQQIALRVARARRALQSAPVLKASAPAIGAVMGAIAGKASSMPTSMPMAMPTSEPAVTATATATVIPIATVIATAVTPTPADNVGSLTDRLLAALPFTLTDAQQRVWAEVAEDLARGEPMHRLVQGDVGSGKTVVAALAAARAIDNGYQAALMAPTEILAEQHFGRIAAWLQPLGVKVAWLSGRQRAAERREALHAAASGEAPLVVGTHALIQQGVRFAQLGLAIVDEQHRFGVVQRLQLRQGSADAAADTPHLLMLSATPIPRTLAMSYLADLDVSVIDAMPPGRRPVVTKLMSARRREDLVAAVRAQVERGEQVYWVCPQVAPGDEPTGEAHLTQNGSRDGTFTGQPESGHWHAQQPARDLAHRSVEVGDRGGDASHEAEFAEAQLAATVVVEALRAALPELCVGLIHGQLPAAEKAAVMAAFVSGSVQVLVATTVVEVGVDVANATLMVIDHAQRFGLSQLHQLRGRVGRGAAESFCVLVYHEPLSATARERLRIIHGTHDGFEIARRDLALRGPGEFLGARQSGQPMLQFADLEQDAALLVQARALAQVLMRDNPQAARAHVTRWLASREGYLAA